MSRIRRLHDCQRGFLQVLLDQFTLSKQDGGLLLDVLIDGDTPAITDLRGKLEFNASLSGHERARGRLQRQLDAFLHDPHQLSYRFDCSRSRLRYANGGVLPVVRLGKFDYFCLFYRDIFPIGWNISNGASDCIGELLDPGRVILREFGEELLIFDHNERIVYCYDPGDHNRPPGFQTRALDAWGTRLGIPGLSNYKQLSTPLKWINGPDKVQACVQNQSHASDGYFLSVTPEDNAVEVDRIALLNFRGDVSIVDGEITNVLLNRLVGMFRVDRFKRRLKGNEFTPDFYYFDGSKRDAANLAEDLHQNIQGLRKHRNPRQLEEYANAPTRLNLCPITRRIIERFYRWQGESGLSRLPESEGPAFPSTAFADNCEVFISYRSENTAAAERLHRFLTQSKPGFRVFCGAATLSQLGESNFVATINRALDSARCLVVFGTAPEHFQSGWVEYEWMSFLNEILSGRKRTAELFALVDNVAPTQLPYGLRNRQIVPYVATSPQESFEHLAFHIRAALARPTK